MNNVKRGIIIGIVGTVSNLVLAFAKLIVGILTMSISIQSDAINNFGDVISSIAISLSFVISNKKATKKHPFGYGRFEYVISFGIAIIIIVVAIEFVITSIKRIFMPQSIVFSWTFFIIIAIGILIKLAMGFYYGIANKNIKSSTIRAAKIDSFQDVLISTATLISLGISAISKLPLDGIIGLVISIIILISGMKLVKDTIRKILGSNISKVLSSKIMSQIMSYQEVLGAHDLLVHDYGQHNLNGSVHVELNSELLLQDAHRIIDLIEKDIFAETGVRLVVHADPVDLDDTKSIKYRNIIRRVLERINPALSFHDFQIDKELKTISVHLVIPFDLSITEDTILLHLNAIDFDGYAFEYIIDNQ